MRYLVVGNALTETIVRSEDGAKRTHIGGVGAIMARELAQAGADVTLLTTAPAGWPADVISAALTVTGVTAVVVPGDPPQLKESGATITTRKGGPIRAQGAWPRMGGISREITRMAPEFDWTLVSLTLRAEDLTAASRSSRDLAVNATSKGLAPMTVNMTRKSVCTMNQIEAAQIVRAAGARGPTELPEALGADTVMVTRGARGRTLYRRGQEPETSEPVPVPEGADFIGAGDAATAGLVAALACRLDVGETVDRYIAALLERNAAAFRRTGSRGTGPDRK